MHFLNVDCKCLRHKNNNIDGPTGLRVWPLALAASKIAQNARNFKNSNGFRLRHFTLHL